MLSRVTSLFRNEKKDSAAESSKLAPEQPFTAVGDIHGCDAQLEALLVQLDQATDPNEPRIFLGDYIDRGPQSKQVLARLFEHSLESPDQAICLKGNHEQMLLDFIDDPAGKGQRWLQHGGRETLASFGIVMRQKELDSTASVDLADKLEAALPRGMQDWLRQLPLRWSSGNLHCVHAAMSPKRSLDDQRSSVLLWGHPEFMTSPRSDDNFVVHGHTIVKQAGVFANRVSLDTGVYRTGRLTGVRVSVGGCEFFEAQKL